MASIKYTYSIANDTANGAVNGTSLVEEIQASAIMIALDNIDAKGDVLDVWFKDALSISDETALSTLIGAHTGAPPASPPMTDEGVSYVTLLPGKSGRVMLIEGVQFDANAGDTIPYDLVLAETREIQGAWVTVANNEKGDYIELQVLTPTNEVVGIFAKTVYIPPDGKIDPIVSESTVSFPPGFKFRLEYTAVSGGATREIYGGFRMRHAAS